jgi:hypothetical protein
LIEDQTDGEACGHLRLARRKIVEDNNFVLAVEIELEHLVDRLPITPNSSSVARNSFLYGSRPSVGSRMTSPA